MLVKKNCWSKKNFGRKKNWDWGPFSDRPKLRQSDFWPV